MTKKILFIIALSGIGIWALITVLSFSFVVEAKSVPECSVWESTSRPVLPENSYTDRCTSEQGLIHFAE